MNKDVVIAELNTEETPTQKLSWKATTEEVTNAARATRGSKPEVLYHFDQATGKKVVVEQIQSPFKNPCSKPAVELEENLNPELHIVQPVDQILELIDASQQALAEQPAQPQLLPELVEVLEGINNHNHEDLEDVFFSDTDDMGEEKTVLPAPFSGQNCEDADAWLRHFLNYCKYKSYNDEKSLALMRVLLTGNAAVWLESLDLGQETANAGGDEADTETNFDKVKKAFEERYKTPEIMRFRSAKEIFSRRQKEDESSDDFVSAMRKLARNIQADEKLTILAILNGLKSSISSYVTQQKPQTLDQLLEAARVAELTMPLRASNDAGLSQQLAQVQEDVKRLTLKWDKFVSAPVFDRRSPSPSGRKVTFAQPESRMRNWTPRMQTPNFANGDNCDNRAPRRTTFSQRQRFDTNAQQRRWDYRPIMMCQKCGRQIHAHPNLCPAINKSCNICFKRGHFSRCCKSAVRSQRQI